MSNVLLEACATGRPIITTDRPGCREIVDDGVNGYIVKQQDKQDCIEKIKKFINLPYEDKREMGEAARRKVEREFDRQIVVNAYLEEIDSLC
jgi:galacturonosyltransferase